MKQKEVAATLKISQGFMSKIFNGRALPSPDKADDWKSFTGWTYDRWRKAPLAHIQKLLNRIGGENGRKN
jgi:hypothetical protein